MFLLNLAYQKKFSSFSSVSITSLLPCHRAQSDVCGTSFYTLPVLTTDSHVPEKKSSLPTNNPYLFTPLSGAQLVEEKITTHWWSGVSLHITDGSSYRTETSQKLFWNDCAVLPSMSAGLLLQKYFIVCFFQNCSAVINALVQHMHIGTCSYTFISYFCLMKEAH